MGSANNMTAYKTGGLMWSWGCNSYGQIGINTQPTSYSSPVAVLGAHSFMIIEAGLTNDIGLKQDGSAWVTGANDYGQIGNNTANSYSSPVTIVGAHSFIQVITGARLCMGLKVNGQAWAWGNNQAAGLGDGTFTNRSSPVQVVGSHSFRVIRTGGITSANFSAGLKADGSLWTWGSNGFGQLGDNSITAKTSPVAVVGNHSFIAFALGTYATFGLKSTGQVWCWGSNSYGELGTNNLTSYSSPVQVVGAHSFIDIQQATNFTTAGLKSDGTVWTWGFGNGIGNNTTNSYSSPVAVIGAHSFIQIRTTGGPCIFGLKSTGTIWGWGTNTFGQIGNNTLTNYSSPVAVIGAHSFVTMQTGIDIMINIAGVWKRRPILWVNVAGTWKRSLLSNINASGTWGRPARDLR